LPEAAQGSVEAAFRHVIGHLTDVLLHFAPLAGRDDADTEPVHQMRVAVRRARSAIAIFRPVLDCPSITAAAQTLKTLGQQLAPVRDWDVFVTETAPTLHAMLGDEPHLARLVAAAQRRRHEVHVALRSWLASPAFRRAGIELAWLAGAAAWDDEVPPPPPDGQRPTLPGFAAHVLQRRWKKLLSAGKEIEELDVPALHQVRLRAKRARYAAEIFLPLFKAKEVKRSIRRLSQLQQNLGSLNDAAMAQHLLDTFGGANGRHAYATGLAVGCLAANAARLRPEILRSWDKFARLDPFWT
jgi:CHAD domain-containing protein